MNRNRRAINGFTLIELMVTMAIAAIILTQAVPSFRAMIANNKITSQVNEFVTAINMGRSEAAKLNTTVILCGSGNPTAAAPSCGGAVIGWILFASGDANNTFNSGTDTLLRVGTINQTIIQVGANSAFDNGLQINANGSTNEAGVTAILAVCDDRDGDATFDVAFGREVRVQPSGHIQTIPSPITTCSPV